VAMADFFIQLQAWETEATAIQEDYKKQIEAYQDQADVYKSEAIAYQQELIEWQIGQASAVTAAEGVVLTFKTGFGWTYVDKENGPAYWGKIIFTWLVQSGIIMILFIGILFLQKRKDVT